MRVTLVHPAGCNSIPGKADFTVLVNRMIPTGILQLAAVLDQANHTSFVYDCLGPDAAFTHSENVERILATHPDLIGFSATTSAFLDAYEMAVQIRAKVPSLKIVFGGPHASSCGAALLRHFPAIDYLCIGEGEGLLLDLAAGKPLNEIPNLVYREGTQILANPRRPRILLLDQLTFPAYEKLSGFPEKYHLPLFGFAKRPGATMITSRGCTFRCSYCDRTVFQRQYTSNSPSYVYSHMKWIRDRFGIRHVNFYDDLFTANRSRVLELCKLLQEDPLGMDFNCAIRVGQAPDDILTSLKRAGCFQISIGVESADPKMLARHKPGLTLGSVTDTLSRAHRVGLRVKGLFIFGLPGESPQTVQNTSDFIAKSNFDEVNISKFSPFYGAPLWAACKSGHEGKLHEDWRLMNCLHFTYIPEGFKSRAQMDYLYNQCISRFYRGNHYHWLFVKRLWVHRWSFWQILRHLPAFVRTWGHFRPSRFSSNIQDAWPAPHASQPHDVMAHVDAAPG